MAHHTFSLPLWLAGLGLAGTAQAVPESLLRNSPFGATEAAAVAPAPAAPRLELRGLFSMGGVPRFAIFDVSTQKAAWMQLNQVGQNGLRVTSYDPSSGAVTVEVDGQPVRLAMKKAEIVTMVAPPSGAPVVAPTPGGPAVGPRQPPSSQEIEERRKAILQELGRRRALRAGQPAPVPAGPSAQ